jgi:RNA polymerase sigma-70 factor (ECF subfamily)
MDTKSQCIDLELIRRAQQGRQDSESLLAELTEKIIFPYLYRLTFNYHLAQDLCQETLIEMHRSLTKLEFNSKQAFFAWIYRTALSKVQKYYRPQGSRRLHTISQSVTPDLNQRIADHGPDQVDIMIQKELLQAAVASMRTLKLSYRNIVTLRCFDGLSYDEIASIEGRSQLACRLMFCKAKKTLRKNLARRGFDNSYLLPALTLIGTVTLPETASAAAVTKPVAAGVLSAGKGISLLSMIVSKAGVLVVVCLAAMYAAVAHLGWPAEKDNSTWTIQQISRNVREGVFACPTQLIRNGIPAGVRLVSVDPTSLGNASWQEPGQSEETIDLDDVAVYLNIDDPRYIKLYKSYWIECIFGDNSLRDGPGPDIFVTANGCKYFRIILTDGRDREYELGVHNCRVNHTQEETMSFDLRGHDIGFEPKAVRFYVNEVDTCGLELRSICARIKN